jgi:predicted enzyme related to lactoylglutathione lyase
LEDVTMVSEIAFFAYSVSDVPRARAFYGETMGLTQGDSFGDHWVEFDVGGTTFGIGNGETLGFEPGASTGAVFEVDDMAGIRRRLIESGVEVGDVHEFPACVTCFARDPDGNRFGLHQRRPPVRENVA